MNTRAALAFATLFSFVTTTSVQAVAWTDPSLQAGATAIKAAHITELRDTIENIIDGSQPISGGGKWTDGAGGDIYYNAGDVGIGVSNPSVKLDISGAIRATSHVQSGSGSGGVALTVNDGKGNANVTFNHMAGTPGQNGTAGRIEVNTDSTGGLGTMDFELGGSVTGGVNTNLSGIMRLQSDGKVGIGTISPAAQLHVNGGNVEINGSGTIGGANMASAWLLLDGGTYSVGLDPNEIYAEGIDLNIGTLSAHGINFNTNGNSNRVKIASNGNVGIGTTNPSQKLHVLGNTYLEGNLYLGNTDTSLFRDLANRIATDDSFYVRSASPATYLYSTNTYLGNTSGDTTHLRGNNLTWNQGIIQGNGNMGIGTTSPSQKLEVVGTVRLSGASTNFQLNDTDDNNFLIHNNSNRLYFMHDANDNMAWDDGDDDRITMYSPGNGLRLGIGMSTPTTELDVAGTVTATAYVGNGSGLTALNASNLTTGTLDLARIANNSIPAGKLAANSVGLSELSATGTKNTTTFLRGDNTWATVAGDNLGNHSASQPLYLNNQPLVSAGGTNFDFIRHNDGTNTWNFGSDQPDTNNTTYGGGTIQAGSARFNGRSVFLGTGDQRIYGDNGSAMFMDSNHSTVTQMLFRDKEDTIYGRVYGDSNGSNFGLMDGDANWAILSQKDNNIQFRVNNSEKMRILANGNVGIGTASPSASLHVEDGGDLALTSTGHAATFGQQAGLNIGIDGNEIMARNNGAESPIYMQNNGGDFFVHHAQGGGTEFVVKDNGSVGIGTTGPAAKLHVVANGEGLRMDRGGGQYTQFYNNASGALLQTVSPVGNAKGFTINATNAGNAAPTAGDNYIRFLVQGAEHMRVLRNGRVGIGTTAPTHMLHVNGDTRVNGWLRTDGNTGWYSQTHGGGLYMSDTTWIRTYGNKSFYHNTGTMRTDGTFQVGANGNRFVVQTGGNVGIGTTTPSSKLHVAGDIKVQSNDTTIDGVSVITVERPTGGSYMNMTHGSSYGYVGFGPALTGGSTSGAHLRFSNADIYSPNNFSAGSLKTNGRTLYLGNQQTLYGDNGSALYYDSNNSNTTQMIFRDKENNTYGRVYGSGNGSDFGLLDGDGHWGIRMQKDNNIMFSINNSEKVRIKSNGNVGIGTSNPESVLHVDGTMQFGPHTGEQLIFGGNSGRNFFAPRNSANNNWDWNKEFGFSITDQAWYFDGDVEAGKSSGAVALTTNDGGGNANVTFNHTSRVPDVTGNAGRITVNVDATTNPTMEFQLAENLAANTANNTTAYMRVTQAGVNANNYCDINGNNCTAASAIKGITTFASPNTGLNSSSRAYNLPINYGGQVTYYSADQNTANYICRKAHGYSFGYWRDIKKPDSSGWAPYGNLAITAFDPATAGGRRLVCNTGSGCYNGGNGYAFGDRLHCYNIAGLPSGGTIHY